MKKIVLGGDHAIHSIKDILLEHLNAKGVEVQFVGPPDGQPEDYPDVAAEACQLVTSGAVEGAILICGTGIGISMAANKIPGIRAAHVQDPVSAALSRSHNDANVLCMGARILGPELMLGAIDAFLETPFSGDTRHTRRVTKIGRIEQSSCDCREDK